MSIAYPFTAIVGQDDMRRALTIAAVDPGIGGVLVLGERGTGKSTTIRALAALLPKIDVVRDCVYHCDPKAPRPGLCDRCGKPKDTPDATTMTIPVVDLPLGSTEDRVVGALDIERALVNGEKAFQPGLLAQANRGFLYVDEVNLLEDHIVDALLDVAASGENVVEREGLSIRHPARFVLVGSGNPEEGELRPQLQDRFGLSVDVRTPLTWRHAWTLSACVRPLITIAQPSVKSGRGKRARCAKRLKPRGLHSTLSIPPQSCSRPQHDCALLSAQMDSVAS